MDFARFRRPRFIIPLATAILVVGGLIGWTARHQIGLFESQGVSFSHPAAYADQTFTAESNTIALLKRSQPESTLTLAHEPNADKGALIAKTNFLDNLESNMTKSLPMSYRGYQKDNLVRLKVADYDASRHDFHYLGRDNHTQVFARLYIITRGHDAYYLTVESPNKNTALSDAAAAAGSIKLP